MIDQLANIDAPYQHVQSHEVICDAQRLLVAQGPYAYLLLRPERDQAVGKGHSVLQLRGLGREVWAGVSADSYVQALRNEWPSGD